MSLVELSKEFRDDVQSVNDWASELYQTTFGEYFKGQRELYKRVKSMSNPITDSELEEILTSIPLELFTASEALAEFKLSIEVIKLKMKEKQSEIIKLSQQKTVTAKQQEAELATIEEDLVITVYKSIVDRVTRESDFSRELIMSAKKIFDSRRSTESSMPVGPVVTDVSEDLPDYNPHSTGSKTYIR